MSTTLWAIAEESKRSRIEREYRQHLSRKERSVYDQLKALEQERRNTVSKKTEEKEAWDWEEKLMKEESRKEKSARIPWDECSLKEHQNRAVRIQDHEAHVAALDKRIGLLEAKREKPVTRGSESTGTRLGDHPYAEYLDDGKAN